MSSPLLTLKSVKASDLPRRVNLCPTDARFVQLLNDTIERISMHGNFWGWLRLIRLCIYDGCVTLPRAIASLEAVRACDGVPITGQWLEFLPFMGDNFSGCSSLRFSPMGLVPVYRETCGSGVIRTFLQNAADAGKKVLYQGRETNGKWVRTFDIPTQTWIDGERIALSSPYTDTITSFSGITGVQKDETKDRILVYKVLTTGLLHIATYEYDETLPAYQRFRISPYAALSSNECSTSSCGPKSVEALVKLAYQPLRQDEDFLIITNLGALRLGMQAMKAEQDGDLTTANVLWFGDQRNNRIGCIPLLNQELRTMTGDRVDVRVAPLGSVRLSHRFAGFN